MLRIELFIPESGSLKSKRFAVKSIKERLKSRFNVSVAEVDNADKWQRASLGVAAVANETKFIEKVLMFSYIFSSMTLIWLFISNFKSFSIDISASEEI